MLFWGWFLKKLFYHIKAIKLIKSKGAFLSLELLKHEPSGAQYTISSIVPFSSQQLKSFIKSHCPFRIDIQFTE